MLRQGLPHFIVGYSARADIWTRAVPTLAFLLVAEMSLAFGDQANGFEQAVALLGGVAVMLGAVAAVNRWRGRRTLQLPDRVGLLELAVFIVVPPIVTLIAGHEGGEAALVLGAQFVLLAVVYVTTSYGVLPMIGWAVRNLNRQLTDAGTLVGKSLPLMLIFSTFLFLNAEMWQVANDLPGRYLVAIAVMLVGVASLSNVLSLRNEVTSVEHFETWSEIYESCRSGPVGGVGTRPGSDRVDAVPLALRARLNVELLLFVSRGIVILLVALVVFGFYVVFGLLAVRSTTIEQWVVVDAAGIEGDVLWETSAFGPEIILTEQLLAVSTFISCFAGLQFAVSLITDARTRAEFRADIAGEIREALAVRAVYLDALVDGPAGDGLASDGLASDF